MSDVYFAILTNFTLKKEYFYRLCIYIFQLFFKIQNIEGYTI